MENEVLKYAQIIADECKGKEIEVIAHLLAQINALTCKEMAGLLVSVFGNKEVRIIFNPVTRVWIKVYGDGSCEVMTRKDAEFWAPHFGIEIEKTTSKMLDEIVFCRMFIFPSSVPFKREVANAN